MNLGFVIQEKVVENVPKILTALIEKAEIFVFYNDNALSVVENTSADVINGIAVADRRKVILYGIHVGYGRKN